MIDSLLRKRKKILILDGAMGSYLLEKGIEFKGAPELLNITCGMKIREIHEEYVEAGADIIYTNTFGANPFKLSEFGLHYRVKEINLAAITLAKQASKGKALVALSVGPTGQLLEPMGSLSFNEAVKAFKTQMETAVEGKVDLIVIETMTQLNEARAALLAAQSTGIPVVVTMSFEENGRTLMGDTPEAAAVVLQSMGAAAVGANCSLGPDKLVPVIDAIKKVSKVPVIAKPNAGMPILKNGKTVYNTEPEKFSIQCRDLALKGASLIGGCCGTNPDYIRKLKSILKPLTPDMNTPDYFNVVCSNRKLVFMGPDTPTVVIGERINPTGKSKLSAALKKGDINPVIDEAKNQADAGAHMLDVNVSVAGIDEASTMRKVINTISKIVDLPLSVDSSNAEAIEAGLSAFCGRALVNSVNGSEESLNKVLPLVKKFGAMVIGLTMDESGLPKNTSERLTIAERIIERAEAIGIPRKDVVIDCLTLTAGTHQNQAVETLKALKLVREKLGCLTTLGISNISYGLPNRGIINNTFLAMALGAGLNLPIINPLEKGVFETIKAADLLNGRDPGAKLFLMSYKPRQDKINDTEFHKESNTTQKLIDSIISGDKKNAQVFVTDLLKDKSPFDIIESAIVPALKDVGDKYERGEFFLPQLMLAAETVQHVFSKIKEKFPGSVMKSRGKVLLATVKGDIHDIGKNIVKALLQNHGFEVIDLGKDVPHETIIKSAKENKVKLIGLSALMTTSLISLEKTINAIKNQLSDCLIMVGGAVLTSEYAKKIGADFYAKDAMEGVKIAQRVFR